jgi:hypothetical protein
MKSSVTRWSSGESGGNCLGHFDMSQPFQKSRRKQADFFLFPARRARL